SRSSYSCFFFFLTLRPPPRSTLFPYTTLFRSRNRKVGPVRSTPIALFRRDRGEIWRGGLPEVDPTALPLSSTGKALLAAGLERGDRKSTRLNSSHVEISYAVFCLKKKKINN